MRTSLFKSSQNQEEVARGEQEMLLLDLTSINLPDCSEDLSFATTSFGIFDKNLWLLRTSLAVLDLILSLRQIETTRIKSTS